LRNREAERYARWAAITAGLIALAVGGVYAERAFRRARAGRNAPAVVPVTVQQQSAQFSFSKVDQDRTIFTVRASHATQYKDQNRAVLEDVWITLYGRDGSRNDNIHTRECSYEGAQDVRCQGDVEIDLASANPTTGQTGGHSPGTVEVKTSNLSFNRNTGEASTTAPVEFRFPSGQGRGVGVSYSTSDSIVRIEQAVEFELAASDQTGGMPVTATGSNLEIRRADRTVVLNGPATVKEGARELSADTFLVELDADYRARRAVAEGHPRIRSAEGGGKISVIADRFEAVLNPSGWVEHVVAHGNIAGTRQTAAGTDRFSAAHAEFTMVPEKNLIQDMTATGGVTAESHQRGDSHVLKTDALRVTFSTGSGGEHPGNTPGKADQQRIESAETLAPATIESRSSTDVTTLHSKKFVAQLGPSGRLDKLLGHAGVEVRRQIGNTAPQVLSAAELIATFGAHGDWDTLDQRGNVRFQQADRRASADHADIVRATDTITMDGSPVISDAMSRTTAADVVVNQKSGELHATGGVVSTYVPTAQADALSLGSGTAHISADALSGNVGSSHAMVTYTGRARLWQGESVLDSDQIQVWQDDKKLQATGHVVAVFSQVSGPVVAAPATRASSKPDPRPGSSSLPSSGKTPGPSAGPTLWKVLAPTLTYWSDQGKAHLEGGVVASSDQGYLESRTLDLFLNPATPLTGAAGPPAAASSQGPRSPAGAPGGRQLERALALGGVLVRQGDRRAMAEQAEYTAAEGKFVLSGGQPTIADASSDTTTGHSLTFFVANDTILIDSQEGSRTLTKHRVEK
jgi:lipopolysaccharide export system protein LptA